MSNTFPTSFGSQNPRLGSAIIPKNSDGWRDSGLRPEAKIRWRIRGSFQEIPRSNAHIRRSFRNWIGFFNNKSARRTENPAIGKKIMIRFFHEWRHKFWMFGISFIKRLVCFLLPYNLPTTKFSLPLPLTNSNFYCVMWRHLWMVPFF